MKNKFPKTTQGKIALVKALINGEVKIDDFKEGEIKVTLNLGDGTLPPDWGSDPDIMYVTLNIE